MWQEGERADRIGSSTLCTVQCWLQAAFAALIGGRLDRRPTNRPEVPTACEERAHCGRFVENSARKIVLRCQRPSHFPIGLILGGRPATVPRRFSLKYSLLRNFVKQGDELAKLVRGDSVTRSFKATSLIMPKNGLN